MEHPEPLECHGFFPVSLHSIGAMKALPHIKKKDRGKEDHHVIGYAMG